MATPIEQLQAMRSMGENWGGYGAAPPQASAIELAREFVALLETMLAKSTPGQTTLHVSPTRIGGVLIEWESQSMQHEIEIHPDRAIGFLHLDKTSGNIETRKCSPGAPAVVHPGLLQELRQLLAA
jgi:hypothetical protein